ncbi:MAG: hypothetical protein NVS1B11_33610 [Terriglobales bacterium]
MRMKIAANLSLAVLFYATTALAQHAPTGGVGREKASHGHARGKAGSYATSSSHGKTMNEILSKNTKLSGKLQSLTGMPATQACSGFKNLGQCVAAAHVSKNLGTSFACLKSDMTGQAAQGTTCPAGTGTKRMSLGKAIQTLDPRADHQSESKKAESQSAEDLRGSDS